MNEFEVDTRLTDVLIAALRAHSSQGCKSAFMEMLGRFIGSASPEEKRRALNQRRFIVDRRRPPRGQIGSTSFWECRWQYDGHGALTVHARWCSSIPASSALASARSPCSA